MATAARPFTMMKPAMRHLKPNKKSELALSLKILIPTGLMFFLFVYFSYFVVLPFVETHLMHQKRQMLRSMTTGVSSLFDEYRKKAESGDMTDHEARARALEAVRSIRFGPEGKDYFWVNDRSVVVLMHPYQPELVGKSLRDYTDASGRRVFNDALDMVERSGEGFFDYLWQWQDDPSRTVAKLSYLKLYQPWGWVLGTGLYVEDVHSEIAVLTRKLLWLLMGVVVVSMLFCFYVFHQSLAVDDKRRRAERINTVLIRISNAVNTTFDLEALYPSIHQSLGEIIDVPNFFIALVDRDTGSIAFPYYQDEMDSDYPVIQDIHRSGSLTARVIHTAEPVLCTREETLAWARSQGMPPTGTPAALWLGVPLKIKNEVIGVMAIQSYTHSDHFDDTDVDVFVSVSDQVAVAIERRRNETALRNSFRQYQMLAENHRDVVVSLSPSGMVTYCSPAIRAFGGYEPAEEIGRHFSSYFADASEKERGLRQFANMVQHQLAGNFEMQFKPKSRAPFSVEIGLNAMVEAGRVVSVMCVMRDISERKAAELQLKQARDALEVRVRERTEELVKINAKLENEIREHERTERILRESEEKHRSLVENIPDIIYSTDDRGYIVTVNNPAENFFGYRTEEVLGRRFSEFLHPEDCRMMSDTFERAKVNQTELTKGLQGRLIASDGSTRWVEVNMRRQFNADGRFVRTDGVLRDVTHTKMLQEKLIQSERLAATGQLAASIAHEINSPLQGVTSLLNVIRREYGEDDSLVGHLDLIKGAFTSIRNTVKNLLDLNRPGKEKNQPLRLGDIIEQTGALVKSYLKDLRVGLELALPPDLPVIMGSPQQIGQVFMNLINNAVEAMNADPEYEDRRITIRAAVDGDVIAIHVADTGTGISDEDMSYLFDAFFTRKKKMGMGVGLAICHRIIEDHGGSISVRNRPGRGAEFTVRLPVNGAAPSSA
jgi:PAS domain S-box-containing protein